MSVQIIEPEQPHIKLFPKQERSKKVSLEVQRVPVRASCSWLIPV